MTDNRIPTATSFEEGLGWYPFMIMEDEGDRLEPNTLYCNENVPVYEWVPVGPGTLGHFRAMPHSGGKMAPIVEASNA